MKIRYDKYISRYTCLGLGHEETVAIYNKDTHILDMIKASRLTKVLALLRKTDLLKEPATVVYW